MTIRTVESNELSSVIILHHCGKQVMADKNHQTTDQSYEVNKGETLNPLPLSPLVPPFSPMDPSTCP